MYIRKEKIIKKSEHIMPYYLCHKSSYENVTFTNRLAIAFNLIFSCFSFLGRFFLMLSILINRTLVIN